MVLLDLEPALALERVKARAGLDRIEAEALDFHTRVRDGFQQEAAGDPSRFVCVSAADAPEDVHLRVVAALTPIFAELGVSP